MSDMKSRMAQRFDAIQDLEQKRTPENAKVVDALISVLMERELQSMAVEEALHRMDEAIVFVRKWATGHDTYALAA
jgi:hypothetical protein